MTALQEEFAVIYVRVSSKEQTKNLSIPTQIRQCTGYCEQQRWSVARIFQDLGESAKTTNRPELQSMLRFCRKHRRKINFVVVYAINRLARQTHDHHAIRAMLSSCEIKLRSVSEMIDDSPRGQYMESTFAAMAQLDNDLRAERTTIGMKAALRMGRWTFPPPTGYTNGQKPGPSLHPDPERGPLIRLAFEMASDGTPQMDIVGRLSALGLNVTPTTLNKILRNEIYVGKIVVPKWAINCQGDFEAIVSPTLFAAVRHRLFSGGSVSHLLDREEFPLRRFVRCEQCGDPITGSFSTGRSRKYPYYRCRRRGCGGVSIRAENLDLSFINLLRRVRLDEQLTKLFAEILRDAHSERQRGITEIRSRLHSRLDKLQKHEDRLVDAHLSGTFDERTMKRQLERVASERIEAQIDLDLIDSRDETNPSDRQIELACRVASVPHQLWEEGNLEARQKLQKLVFPNGVTFKGTKFGTAETSIVFNLLRDSRSKKERVVPLRGFEPRLPG